jgi:hypothetical protein
MYHLEARDVCVCVRLPVSLYMCTICWFHFILMLLWPSCCHPPSQFAIVK